MDHIVLAQSRGREDRTTIGAVLSASNAQELNSGAPCTNLGPGTSTNDLQGWLSSDCVTARCLLRKEGGEDGKALVTGCLNLLAILKEFGCSKPLLVMIEAIVLSRRRDPAQLAEWAAAISRVRGSREGILGEAMGVIGSMSLRTRPVLAIIRMVYDSEHTTVDRVWNWVVALVIREAAVALAFGTDLWTAFITTCEQAARANVSLAMAGRHAPCLAVILPSLRFDILSPSGIAAIRVLTGNGTTIPAPATVEKTKRTLVTLMGGLEGVSLDMAFEYNEIMSGLKSLLEEVLSNKSATQGLVNRYNKQVIGSGISVRFLLRRREGFGVQTTLVYEGDGETGKPDKQGAARTTRTLSKKRARKQMTGADSENRLQSQARITRKHATTKTNPVTRKRAETGGGAVTVTPKPLPDTLLFRGEPEDLKWGATNPIRPGARCLMGTVSHQVDHDPCQIDHLLFETVDLPSPSLGQECA